MRFNAMDLFEMGDIKLNMKDALKKLEQEDQARQYHKGVEGIDIIQRTDGKVRRRCLINLDGRFKAVWDYIMLLFILYISLSAPFKVAFVEDYSYYYWDMFDYFIDGILLMDMIITFFTPIYKNHSLIRNHKEIAKDYLSLWFWLDLISVIPFDLLLSENLSMNGSRSQLLKLPKLYRVAKMSKLLKATRLGKKGNNIIARWITKLQNHEIVIISVSPFYFIGIVIAYFFACMWFYIPDNFEYPNCWLERYQYKMEHTHD